MNSIQESSENLQLNFSEDFIFVNKSRASTKPTSQFINYKKIAKDMKNQMDSGFVYGKFLISLLISYFYIDSDIIVIEIDFSSEEKQSKCESKDSSSYFKRFNDSWIRII